MKTFGKRSSSGLPPVVRAPETHEDHAPVQAVQADQNAPLASLREQVLKEVDPSAAANLPTDMLARQIEEIIHEIANQERLELSGREQFRLARDLTDDMTGYGPLRPLLLDDSISDIMVNGPSNVYVERNGKLERVAVRFRDNDHIASVAQKIAARVGRRIDESSPMVDCRVAGRQPGQHHLPAAGDP